MLIAHIATGQYIIHENNRNEVDMFRQILSFTFKVLIVFIIGTVVLSILLVRHFLRLVTDVTNELFRY